MKRLFVSLILIAVLLCSVQSRAGIIVAGSPLIYSNASPVINIPVGLTLNTGIHSIDVTHSGLLATTNMSAYLRVEVVDALTGVTNRINIAQVWQAQSTNAATENIALTNYQFQVNGSILWTTTNSMNLPNGIGAASNVTNSAILNF